MALSARLQRHFPKRDADGRGEIEGLVVLNGPARRRQYGVDNLAGLLFREIGHVGDFTHPSGS